MMFPFTQLWFFISADERGLVDFVILSVVPSTVNLTIDQLIEGMIAKCCNLSLLPEAASALRICRWGKKLKFLDVGGCPLLRWICLIAVVS